jgi:uncharacterized protein YdhG (YjbR/CyaY superfamily)
MQTPIKKFKSVDEYFNTVPENVRPLLEKLRKTILKAAPGAEEVISYQMPALRLHGMLVFYAAWKEHIGFYPASAGMKNFEKELTPYKRSKGTIQFPLNEPLPLDLITRIVKYRVEENKAKQALKRT